MTTEDKEATSSDWEVSRVILIICACIFGILILIILYRVLRKLFKKHDPNKPDRFSYEGEVRHAAKTCSFLR